MNRNAIDFSERMTTGHALAMVVRNRGRHVGKCAAGWNFKPAPDAEAGSWDDLVARARAGYRAACSEARAEYDWQTRLRDVVDIGDGLAF